MITKKKYISPVTTVVGAELGAPIMGTMTLYTGSPYTTMTTVTFGQEGFTSSDGSW